MSILNLARQFLMATCNTSDALQVHNRRVLCTPDSCAESLSNSRPHRTLGTEQSGAHRTRAQRGLQKPLTPDANHRTLSECVRCSTLAGSSAPDAEASVRCLRTQRPVSVSQRGKHSRDFSKFPTGAIEKNTLIFLKSAKVLTPTSVYHQTRGTHTPLNPRKTTSFVNVLTPTSVYHQSACVLAFHKHFHQRR